MAVGRVFGVSTRCLGLGIHYAHGICPCHFSSLHAPYAYRYSTMLLYWYCHSYLRSRLPASSPHIRVPPAGCQEELREPNYLTMQTGPNSHIILEPAYLQVRL